LELPNCIDINIFVQLIVINYLKMSLIQAGFEIVEIRNGILRVEFGKPVASLIMTARRKDY